MLLNISSRKFKRMLYCIFSEKRNRTKFKSSGRQRMLFNLMKLVISFTIKILYKTISMVI